MTDFMDILKNVGDFGQQFGRQGFDQSQEPEPGYRAVRQNAAREARRQAYERDLMNAGQLIKRAFEGDKYAMLMMGDAMQGRYREALSTSDFPSLFGDIIDRSVLQNYRETSYTWNLCARRHEVKDFRSVRVMRVDGGSGLLGALDASSNMIPVAQGGPYLEDKLVDANYTYRLQKYGKRMPFFWETMVDDDLDAIKDTPARFGRGARRSEEYFVTKLFANNTTFYTAANKNVVKSSVLAAAPTTSFTNPPLSITAMQNALLVLASQLDTDGQPISIEAVTLIVPPALEVTANNIINATQILVNDFGGTTQTQGATGITSAQRLMVENWMRARVKVGVNYQLTAADATYGSTGWYLFASPTDRPALEFGLLRGHTTPELYMKQPNSIAIGEGNMGPGNAAMPGSAGMNPMEGDFDADSIHYKIRHVFGGTQLDPKMSVFSNGSNA